MKRATSLLALLLCLAAAAYSDEYPVALEQAGYLSNDWRVVLAWEEATDSGALLRGFHLESLTSGETIDVYLDGGDHVLTESALEELDVPPKRWDAPPVTVAPEIVPGFPHAKAANRPAPWLSLSAEQRVETVLTVPAEAGESKSAEEDGAAKGLTRYGSVVDLPAALSLQGNAAAFGQWYNLPDGRRAWSATVRVLGAVGLRLHFSVLALPAGAELVAYNPDAPDELEPVAASTPGWGPSCFNEAVTLECRLTAGTAAEAVAISVDRVGWMYKLPFEKTATVGSCNINVACRADWLTVAMAVGRLAKANSDGLWACTGALVADTVADSQVPYFLTANHCVSSQSEASSIEVYWLYQSESCDAAPPAMSKVPHTTGGADYLAGTTNTYGTDFAFLRLNNTPPDGLTYAGYSTEAAAVGTPVTAIHQPEGLAKRISFGTITDTGSPSQQNKRLKPIERFHEIHWQQGTTEPGSSGCPLFIQANPLIIGQLYGGYASCGATTEPDYFGRFDVTYPIIQKWLSPATSTEGESGNTQNGCQWFKTADPANVAAIAALVGVLMLTGMLGRSSRS